ncbi:MAG: NAD(+) diphosphatase [Inquilinaceae bacterium]
MAPSAAMPLGNFYIHPALDRATERRRDEAWLRHSLEAATTCLLPVWRGRNLIDDTGPLPRAVTVTADEAWWRDHAGEIVLLGRAGETAYFAVELAVPDDPGDHPAVSGRGRFQDLRAVGPLVAREEGALMAYARGLIWWHSRHRFCGVCGHPTVSADAGHVRRCTNAHCAAQHFPRTDPAVIVLVHDGDRCLLGRQAIWPPGMHSVLAGFLEPGENLEAAVAREVREETGIEVADIRYHSSQPWPFPQSLMVGFTARALTTEINANDDELEDAGWYERSWLRALPDEPPGSGRFALPRKDSIARRLVNEWLAERA